MNLNCRIKRAWLCRTESTSSYRGRKSYAPQVGDSVVYIPKAHKETIRKFMTLKMPWQSWPSGARWPVVRCQILNVRYRFPYKEYFRRGIEARCVSMVAIITLEVTGIPELSTDREFPWPKPAFVARQSRSISHKFEVSIFDNDCPEYIIPETIFLSRIQCLEDALRERANNPQGFNISACYFGDTDEEDPVNEASEAEILQYCNNDSDFDPNLNESGYESLSVLWTDGPPEYLSPWDMSAPEKLYNVPIPPPLTAEEKAAVAKSLSSIEKKPEFREFIKAVDTRQFSDYLLRVEVPMDVSFVKQRLEYDYYSSLLSVLSEMRLIRENCQKYNGPDADIAIMAATMYLLFREELKTELGKAGVESDIIMKLDEDNETLCTTGIMKGERSKPCTRSDRASTSRSALELLPPPQQSEPQTITHPSSRGGRDRSILERATSHPFSVVSNHIVGDTLKSKNKIPSVSTMDQPPEFTTTRNNVESEATRTRSNAGYETSQESGRARSVTRSGRIVSTPTRCLNYEENESLQDDVEEERIEEYHLEEEKHSEQEEESTEESAFSEEYEDDQDDNSDSEDVVCDTAQKTRNTRIQKHHDNATTVLATRHSSRIQKEANNLDDEKDSIEHKENKHDSTDDSSEEVEHEHKYAEKNRGIKTRIPSITRAAELNTHHSFQARKGTNHHDAKESDVSSCEPAGAGNKSNYQDDAKSGMPIRQSTRVRKRKSYEDVDSDFDMKLESEEDKSDSEPKGANRVKTRISQQETIETKSAISPRYSARKSTTTGKMTNTSTRDGSLAKNSENISDIHHPSTRKRKGINYQDEDSDIDSEFDMKLESEEDKSDSEPKGANRMKTRISQEETIETKSTISPRYSARKSTTTGKMINTSTRNRSLAKNSENISDIHPPSTRKRKGINYQDEDSDIDMKHELSEEEEEDTIRSRSRRADRAKRQKSRQETIESRSAAPSRCSVRKLTANNKHPNTFNHDGPFAKVGKSSKKTNRESTRSLRRQEKKALSSSSSDEDEFDEEESGEDSEDSGVDSEDSGEDSADSGENSGENSDENIVPVGSKRRIQVRCRDTRSAQKHSRTVRSIPELDKWPDIDVKDITRISKLILEKIRSLDIRGLFEIPVIEAHPEIAKSYSHDVKSPMDFRTIEEEKLQRYDNITQLRDDLIQIFKNCVDWNGEKHDFGQYAITLWEQIDKVFYKVHGEMHA